MLDRFDSTSWRPPFPWDPQLRGQSAGFAAIALAAALAAGFGSPPWGIVLLTAAASTVVAAVWAVRARDRADRTTAIVRDFEEELRAARQRFQRLRSETRQNASVLLQMTDGVVVLAPDRSILLINPSARRLLALRGRDSLLGRSFPEVVRIPEVVAAVREASGRPGPREVMVEVRDESVVRPLRIRVDRIETAAESNLLLTIRDETEARRVDEIRREFVANVSHELKTPLAAIKGYAETVELALEDDPGAATHFLSQIQSQCVRLERLVADMMQLARAQSGPTNLNPIEMTLGEIVAESLKSYRPVARAKGIELTVGDDGRAAAVLADREATLTIANNLIGNAIRYTPDDGHVTVDVRGRDGFWALIVSDDGVGISQSEQERIFERFYRAERTRDTERGGTGLGLSIVKNLTLAQGGEVKLTSQPGVGSTFEVWLPAAATASVSAS